MELLTLMKMYSFMVLRRLCPSLLTMLEVFHWCAMVCSGEGVIYGWKFLQMFFKPFHKDSDWLSKVLFITFKPAASVPVHNFIFYLILSLSFGVTRMFFNVLPILKCICMPCFLHMSLILPQSMVYGMTMWSVLLLGGSTWMLSVVFGFLCVVFVLHYGVIMEFLHLVRTSQICFTVLSSSGIEQTVLALYVDSSIWQWLSHYK